MTSTDGHAGGMTTTGGSGGLAIGASARVVVLPCCQDEATGDPGGLGGWLDGALAIDVTRAARLRASRDTVYTQTLPGEITAKNRLLMGAPPAPGEVAGSP